MAPKIKESLGAAA